MKKFDIGLLTKFESTGEISFAKDHDSNNSILITGDFCPFGRPEDFILSNEPEQIFDLSLRELIKEANLTITNLECPLTERASHITKTGPVLKSSPNCAKGIAAIGIDVVSLANNHICDFGPKGVSDTLEICSKYDIKTVGAGRNIHHAREILYISIDQIIVAILAGTESEYSIAGDITPGASPLSEYKDSKRLQEANQKADLVVFILHGGNVFYSYPNPRMQEYCRFLVEQGANAVVCHHSHVISGFEIYNGAPIIYGTGNFMFDSPKSHQEGWYTGYLVKILFSSSGISSVKLIPCKQHEREVRVEVLKGSERVSTLRTVAKLSIEISENREVKKKWIEYCNQNKHSYLSSFMQLSKLEAKIYSKTGKLFPWRWNIKRVSELLNIIRCESHRAALIEILENQTKEIDF